MHFNDKVTNKNINIMNKGFGKSKINFNEDKDLSLKLKKAFDFENNNNLIKAIEIYTELIKKKVYKKNIFLNIARLYKKSKQTNKLIEILEKTILLYPNDIEIKLLLGMEYMENSSFKDAENLFLKIINKDKTNSNAIGNLSICLMKQGLFEEAEYYALYLVNINPSSDIAYANLGAILRDQGKFKKSEEAIRKSIKLNNNLSKSYSNLAMLLLSQRKIIEAEHNIKLALDTEPFNSTFHSNYAHILYDKSNLNEAKLHARKAILYNKLNHDSYNVLSKILISQGEINEAINLILKSISIKKLNANAYFQLSRLSDDNLNMRIKNSIISVDIDKFKRNIEKAEVYFAKSNIFHKNKDYILSSENLIEANKIKLKIYPSDSSNVIEFTNKLYNNDQETNYEIDNFQKSKVNSIFIVGMPRCGSTLIESILSMNKNVYPLGENNNLFSSYKNCKKESDFLHLENIYTQIKSISLPKGTTVTTDKYLYNYVFSGLISRYFKRARIIHCKRDPLDNILSIFRANFSHAYRYSSCIKSITKVLINQEIIMNQYLEKYKDKIYSLNYDKLVSNPKDEISKLIEWLGWEWDNIYTEPHLNKRDVLTASNIRVRSPINSNSSGI